MSDEPPDTTRYFEELLAPPTRDLSPPEDDQTDNYQEASEHIDLQQDNHLDMMTAKSSSGTSNKSTTPDAQVNRLIGSFHLADDSLRSIKAAIGRELELGLKDEDQATVKMLITYVRELSRGDETGSYLALDLGGTHFRVLLVSLSESSSEPKVTSVVHDIPADLLTTRNGPELFDYIASRLLDFVQQYKLKRRRISLGFTFSFPCKQYGLTQSILVKWCKGFNVGGVIGTDVVKQLKNALKRQLAGRVEAYIDVVAVINDTTGTLVACASKHRECRIGLIVGTGFNACYLERLDRCEKWPANYTSPKQVIINCEWGAMGDNRERRELDKFRTEFDARVDADSVNPNNQTYEKMVGGMYVGELLRLAMLRLHEMRVLFTGSTCCGLEPQQVQSATGGGGGAPAARSPAQGKQRRATNSKQPACCDQLTSVKSTASNASGARASKSSLGSSASVSASSAPEAAPRTVTPPASTLTAAATTSSERQQQQQQQQKSKPTTIAAKLSRKDIFNGKHLSLLAKDELSGQFEETAKILDELQIREYSQADMRTMIRLGAAIMNRSAHLVASGISALLERIQRPYTVVGYDGSLIKHHPYFLRRLIEKTSQLTPAEHKFEFIESSDGSGIGAAIVAAALHKERRPLYIVKPGRLYEMHFMRAQSSQISLEGHHLSAIGGQQPQQQQSTRLDPATESTSAATKSLAGQGPGKR